MQNISKGCKIILILILSIVLMIRCGNSAPRKSQIDSSRQKSKRNAGFMNYFNSMVYETSFNYPTTYSWSSYAPSQPSYDYSFIQQPVDSSINNLDGNFDTILSFDYNWPENDMKKIDFLGAVPENNNDRALILTNAGKDDSFTYILEKDCDYDIGTDTSDLKWNFPPHGIDESIFNSFYLIPDNENPNRERVPQTTEMPTGSPISNKIDKDQTPNISIFNCFSDPDQKKLVENALSNKDDEYMVLLIKRNHFVGAKEDEKKTEIIITQPAKEQEEPVVNVNNFNTEVPEEDVLSQPNPVLVELEEEKSVSSDINLGQVTENSPVSISDVNQEHVTKTSTISIDSVLDVSEGKVIKSTDSTPYEEQVTKTFNVSTDSRTGVIQEQVIRPLTFATNSTPEVIQKEITKTSAVATDSKTEVIQKQGSIPTEILGRNEGSLGLESSSKTEYNVSVVDIHQNAKTLQNTEPIISETVIVNSPENPISIIPEEVGIPLTAEKEVNKPDEEINTEIMTKNEVNSDITTINNEYEITQEVPVETLKEPPKQSSIAAEGSIVLPISSLISAGIPASTLESIIKDTSLKVDDASEIVSNMEESTTLPSSVPEPNIDSSSSISNPVNP